MSAQTPDPANRRFDASCRGGSPPWCASSVWVLLRKLASVGCSDRGGVLPPPKRLLSRWGVLVNVPNTVSGVLPPKLAARTRSRGLGRPVPSRRCSDYSNSRPLKGLGGLDRPPTVVTRPMVSPASAVPFEWVSEGEWGRQWSVGL